MLTSHPCWVTAFIVRLRIPCKHLYLLTAPPLTAFCTDCLHFFFPFWGNELPISNIYIKKLSERGSRNCSSSQLTFVISLRREIGGQLVIVIGENKHPVKCQWLESQFPALTEDSCKPVCRRIDFSESTTLKTHFNNLILKITLKAVVLAAYILKAT